jgi:eukaryotic-like serine/threonine-protein kinase
MSARERKQRPGTELGPGLTVVRHLVRSRTFDLYDAWSEERRCRVVVKTLRPAALGDRDAARRLRREGRLLRALDHPHLVRAYETLPGPPPLIVLETVGGETLAHLIDRRRLVAADLAVLGLQLASAVGYLHGRGWLHLDLKPSNIVIEARRPKILDLSVSHRPGRARPGTGTWCYMAPEQARGDELGEAADVWGISVTLWEAATTRLAFGDSDIEEESAEYPQLHRAAEPVSRHRRLPAPLARAIDLGLQPDPARRPTIAQLWALFERVPNTPDMRRTRPPSR